ncbi:MAG: GTPase HflX [Actinomycetales bacterium]|nr:GTPase HflX [Actinomycetales bacterium]
MRSRVGGSGTDGELAREERAALRRVPGLSTELVDVREVEYRQVRLERVVLVGVWRGGDWQGAQRAMTELARLAETAGSLVCDALVQRRQRPDPATFIGSGKAEQLAEIVRATGADTVICDGELSASQLRALEQAVGVKVVDRTWLILDIFAQHARTREGKAQVALAQMSYLLPRLRGWGESMSRTGGGIGTRGPGETKLESDRRRVREQIGRLRRQLDEMARTRVTQRRARRRSDTRSIAIVGYTNAGKSSLLNRLTGSDVLIEDALFATLDPTVRRVRLLTGEDATLTDTVGFIRHLPHALVESFRSTLEEIAEADCLIHVVDASDADAGGQMAAVRAVLAQIGADRIPEVLVLNKVDVADAATLAPLRGLAPQAVEVSARTGAGLAELGAAVAAACRLLPAQP